MRKLHELVEIRSGYTFRSSIDSFATGDTEVIQAKDLDDLNLAILPKITFPGEPKHLLQPGDILVSARGYSRAQLFQESESKTVAASSVFILTPKNETVSAEFITMFFNSSLGVRAMIEMSSGSSVKTITKENLGQIYIPELPPDTERALGKVVQSLDDELDLMNMKQLYLEHLRRTIISKTLKETKA